MARKTLLTESEIRKFMKLANITPLQEIGSYCGDDDAVEDLPGNRDELYEEEAEEELEVVDEPAPVDDMEMDMGAEMDVPVDDVEMGADVDVDREDQFKDIVSQLADLLGLEVEMDDAGEEDVVGDVEADEGGELEVDAAPEVDMEPEEVEEPVMENNEEEVVEETAPAVTPLARTQRTNELASKLAERIFKRLASK